MLRHYLTDTGHPARLFRGGEPGFCLPSVAEAFLSGALWQDSAGSTPIDADWYIPTLYFLTA